MTHDQILPDEVPDGAAVLPLTQGLVAWVDKEDLDAVSEFKWFAVTNRKVYYAQRTVRLDGMQRTQQLHQLLMPGCDRVDHANGRGLDNRRQNLRHATRRQNAVNRRAHGSSKYLGVSWHKRDRYWIAQMNLGIRTPTLPSGKLYIGDFKTEEEAARAYDAASRIVNGEFARLNFPDEHVELSPRVLSKLDGVVQ